jgi:hypothetical protein
MVADRRGDRRMTVHGIARQAVSIDRGRAVHGRIHVCHH